jgi:CBS domain-containing protein
MQTTPYGGGSAVAPLQADPTRSGADRPVPGSRSRDILVGTLMTRRVVALDPATGFTTVVAALRKHHHDLLPVVDAEHHVLGTVSSSDLLAKLAVRALPAPAPLFEPRLARALRLRAEGATAGELMTRPAITVTPRTTASDAAWLAVRHRIHHLPVVDEHQRLAGLVCLCDLLGALRRDDDAIRSEVLYLAVSPAAGVDRASLIVDCKDGQVVLNATTALRSQAETLRDRVLAVEGVVDLIASLRWHSDDHQA